MYILAVSSSFRSPSYFHICPISNLTHHQRVGTFFAFNLVHGLFIDRFRGLTRGLIKRNSTLRESHETNSSNCTIYPKISPSGLWLNVIHVPTCFSEITFQHKHGARQTRYFPTILESVWTPEFSPFLASKISSHLLIATLFPFYFHRISPLNWIRHESPTNHFNDSPPPKPVCVCRENFFKRFCVFTMIGYGSACIHYIWFILHSGINTIHCQYRPYSN